jgi:hypothetical protein
MKNLIFLFLFAAARLAGENYWDNFVNVKKEGQEYRAFADSLPVRNEPGQTKALSFYLRCGDNVSILAKTELLDNLIGIKEYWYQISANDKEGYVWGGSLADYCTRFDDNTLLVRNNGIALQSLDLRVFGPDLAMTQIRLPSGPVNSDDGMTSDLVDPKLFASRPKMIFSLGYFVFSEIEMGFDERTICTVDTTGVIWTHFSWIPSSCDPPMCMETFVLFPGDSLPARPEEKRARYEGLPNGVRLVMHDWDMDDSLSHEYSVRDYLWNGAGFKEQ